MASCKACGVELRQGARFCDMCGAKVEKICPSCGRFCESKPSSATCAG